FGFLQLDHLAELVGLAGLALADDFGRWLEPAQNFALDMDGAMEEARPGLMHHPSHQRHHLLKLRAQAFQRDLVQNVCRSLHALRYLRREPFRLSDNPARRIKQAAISLLTPAPIEPPPA